MGNPTIQERCQGGCAGEERAAHGTSGQEAIATGSATPPRPHARATATTEHSDLLGRISHELCSPLAAIKGYAATLRRHERRLSADERQEYLSAIEDAATRLDTIVGRMLLLSQLESGSIVPVRAPVDVVHLVSDAVNAAQANGEPGTRAHPCRLNVLADAATVIDGDPRLLRVVLDQLIENAIKFSLAGDTIEVTVQTTDGAPPAHRAETSPAAKVTVRNTGRAIPPEHLERIFDRFHQADSGLTREVGGLGVGLAICQRILALHGGSLVAHSEAEGATFTLRLPLSA